MSGNSQHPGDGGGHQVLGRAEGRRHCNSSGYAFLHTALDDHSRLAYTETLPDEKALTCSAFLRRAHAWFANHGITIHRVLTDNAWAYRKTTWHTTCAEPHRSPRITHPGRPQTKGTVERFLLDEWAHHQPCTSEIQRHKAFPDRLDC